MFTCRLEDLLTRHHDAEVDYFVAVTTQHYGHNVLADIVYVTLYRGDDQFAFSSSAGAGFFFFDERHQMGDRLLHDTGRLHHLWQEHFSGAKEIAHGVHARHQGAFDHSQGRLPGGSKFGATFFGVGHHVVCDALHHGVAQSLGHGPAAPGQIFNAFFGGAFHVLCKVDQCLTSAGVLVEHHIFDLGA